MCHDGDKDEDRLDDGATRGSSGGVEEECKRQSKEDGMKGAWMRREDLLEPLSKE